MTRRSIYLPFIFYNAVCRQMTELYRLLTPIEENLKILGIRAQDM